MESQRIIEAYDRRYARSPQQPPPPWQSPGAVLSYRRQGSAITFVCESARVECLWLTADSLRVRVLPGETGPGEPFSYAVIKTDWEPVELSITETAEACMIHTAAVVCRVEKEAFALHLETLDGQHVYSDNGGPQWRADGQIKLGAALQPDEAAYGLGERAHSLNLRGRRLALWNLDPGGYTRGDDPINYSIPFYIGLHRGGVYGLFWDNSHRGMVDIGASRHDTLGWEAEGGELRFYLFAPQDINSILERYTALTGRMPLPPLWGLGYHQCRYSYYPQKQVLKIAREMRRRSIPCDAIYLDIHYMDGYRIFTWDKKRFPDFAGMIDELHEMGFRVVSIIDPGVKIDPEYPVYTSGIEQDVFLKYPDGEQAMGVVWPGECHFPDFTDPAARAWWARQAAAFLETGVDGIWNDMCEPVIFLPLRPGDLPDYVVHSKEGLGGDHLENHNVYGTLMGRATRDALLAQYPDRRPFNIIRAGFAGAQRYASSWTADNYSRWDDLLLSISMVLNMGLSGAPLTGPDVGGFMNHSTPELLARWTQAACLMPFFRNHSADGTIQQEPWSFGEPYESICRAAVELRYRLLPYLYSVVARSARLGHPIVRPLFMAEPDNPALRDIDDCYLLGDHLLVAPVLHQGATGRPVHLPKGTWYDYWTGTPYEGGRVINVDAPLDHLPLFVRAGATLPHWPLIQHVAEPVTETILRIYAGSSQSGLYEDAGEGFAYEQGDYRQTTITVQQQADQLQIERSTEGRYRPQPDRLTLEIIGLGRKTGQVLVDGQPATDWHDDGVLRFSPGPFTQITIR